MDIIAVTVSVNYSDILEHMIIQNIQFLKKWFIVTAPEDKKTIDLLENYKHKITVLIYDGFYINNHKFNKGGAIKCAQDYIDLHFKDENILILDSDIYLPDDFTKQLPPIVEPHTLYGVSERIDYWTLDDFNKCIKPHVYSCAKFFVGFFQLYKQNAKYKYEECEDCGGCDNIFRELFNKKQLLEISVKHLGKECVNWYGRVSKI
jgi:hypothetical protein